jgi:hypothetical protein
MVTQFQPHTHPAFVYIKKTNLNPIALVNQINKHYERSLDMHAEFPK